MMWVLVGLIPVAWLAGAMCVGARIYWKIWYQGNWCVYPKFGEFKYDLQTFWHEGDFWGLKLRIKLMTPHQFEKLGEFTGW